MGDEEANLDGASVAILEDNSTTGVTLQFVRDMLLMKGADVIAAILVRFPAANRHVQMGMEGHGYPNPDLMFSFVRGLIASPPYTRLLFPNDDPCAPYVDAAGVFDKCRDRIARHLAKNGTPVQ